MLTEAFVGLLRCVTCGSAMRAGAAPARAVVCTRCAHSYALRSGIVDAVGDGPAPLLPLCNSVLRLRGVASIYESRWRPLLCRLVTRSQFGEQAARVTDALRPDAGGPVLDLGTGTGLFARALARGAPHCLVVCADVSKAMLERAVERGRAEGLRNLAFVRADAMGLPFAAGRFSGVSCCGTLHLLPDAAGALREMHRVLVPGGRLACLTYVRSGHALRRQLLALSRRLTGMEFFDRPQLLSELESAGFRDCHELVSGAMLLLGASTFSSPPPGRRRDPGRSD